MAKTLATSNGQAILEECQAYLLQQQLCQRWLFVRKEDDRPIPYLKEWSGDSRDLVNSRLDC